MVYEFTSALHEEIRRELRHIPYQNRQNVADVEQSANQIHRDLTAEGRLKSKSEESKKRAKSPTQPDTGQRGPKCPKKENKTTDRRRPPPKWKSKDRQEVKCYACGQAGHVAPTCTDSVKKEAYYAKKEVKGKGQKN